MEDPQAAVRGGSLALGVGRVLILVVLVCSLKFCPGCTSAAAVYSGSATAMGSLEAGDMMSVDASSSLSWMLTAGILLCRGRDFVLAVFCAVWRLINVFRQTPLGKKIIASYRYCTPLQNTHLWIPRISTSCIHWHNKKLHDLCEAFKLKADGK